MLLFPEKAKTTYDDASTFAFLAHLYGATSTSTSSPTPLSEAHREVVFQEEFTSAAMARGVKDVARGLVVIKIPHLCVPWGRKLGEVLWKRLKVRLERWGGCQRWEGVGVGLRVRIGEDMWPELKGEAREYNEVMINHLEKTWGVGVLGKVANLVRLEYINDVHRDVQKHLARIENDQQNLKQDNVPDSQTTVKRKSLTKRGKNYFTVNAIAVQNPNNWNGRKATPPERYIVNGTLIPSEIFSEFSAVLKEDFGLAVKTVDKHRGAPHWTDINARMKALGTDWGTVAKTAIVSAKRAKVLSIARELVEEKERVMAAQDEIESIRQVLIEKAILYETAGETLTNICALKVAQLRSDPKIAAVYKYLPREVWKLIDLASRRLRELQDAEAVNPSSFAPL